MFSWYAWLSIFEFLTRTCIKEMAFLYFKAAPFVNNSLAISEFFKIIFKQFALQTICVTWKRFAVQIV